MMRPCVGVKPQQRAVIYSDAPIGTKVGVQFKTSTGYGKITWWDGTTSTVSQADWISNGKAAKLDSNHAADPRVGASKISDSTSNKKIILESTNSSWDISGNIIYFQCSRSRKVPSRDPLSLPCDALTPNQYINQIDVSTCTSLKVLKCDRNSLTNLGDIKACKNLATLACSGNCFASLDVSAVANLEQLYCNQNYNLKNLTIGTKLKILQSSSSGMTSFTPPVGSQLIQLTMKDSALTGITLNNATNLSFVNLNTQFDFEGCAKHNTDAITRISANNLSNLYSFIANHAIYTGINSITLQNSGSGIDVTKTVGDKIINNPAKRGTYFLMDFGESNLSSSTLDALYTGLNALTGNSIVLVVSATTGYAGSNSTIATGKGYIVV